MSKVAALLAVGTLLIGGAIFVKKIARGKEPKYKIGDSLYLQDGSYIEFFYVEDIVTTTEANANLPVGVLVYVLRQANGVKFMLEVAFVDSNPSWQKAG